MRRIIIIFPVLLACMVMGVSAGTDIVGKNLIDLNNPYHIGSTVAGFGSATVERYNNGVTLTIPSASSHIWLAERLWWPISAGTYTLQAQIDTNDSSFMPFLSVYIRKSLTDTPEVLTTLTASGSKTITVRASGYIGLYLHLTGDTGNTGTRTVRYYDIQLEPGNTATDYEPYLGLLGGLSGVSGFMSSIFLGLFDVVSRYRIALAAVGLPLLVYILGCIISMVQRQSVFEVAGWRDTGFVGAIKRYRMRQEDKKKQAFATRIFRQNENLDVQYVDIDGQRYYRDHRSRRYKVRLGDRAADYYNPRGDDVPVYDGKRQTRKKG